MPEISREVMEAWVEFRRAVERLLGVEPDSRSLKTLTDDVNALADEVGRREEGR